MKRASQTAVSLVKLQSIEWRHIDDVLKATCNNKTLAAQLLGIDRATLNRKLRRRRDAEQQGSEG